MNPSATRITRISSASRTSRAFTLIELLVVISIIAVISGLVVGLAGTVGRKRMRSTTQAEMHGIITGLEMYKGDKGSYPGSGSSPMTNSLFYELMGVTYDTAAERFRSVVDLSHGLKKETLQTHFNISSFGIVHEPGAITEGYLPSWRPKQYGEFNLPSGGVDDTIYLLRVPGRSPSTNAPGTGSTVNWKKVKVNYWMYRGPDATGKNLAGFNTESFDLWAELPGKNANSTEVVSNW